MAKILVSVDNGLLARIDKEARARGLSRSAYLSQLAARQLEIGSGPGRRASVRSALARLDRLFGHQARHEDATVAVRRERDSR
ncbi:MAG: ribbon-helix-helix protein, CopG family [Actinomycetota bacterium]